MGGPDRSQLVIVALPTENDYVRKISSEVEPHLTLLYLGSPDYDADQLIHIGEYVQYASTFLSQFTLDVERRGVLGDKNADVLFFSKRWWDSKGITRFRENLLQDPLISTAYNAEDQYEGWTPHLTLGYPEAPAKKDPNGYDGDVTFVKFDRIALWIGDYEGPTFDLKPYSYDSEVAMSQIKSPSYAMIEAGTTLTHYGVKGMKWGVRRDDSSGGDSASKSASADYKTAASAQQKIDTAGTHTLSNQELQGLINRMNLERQYSNMTTQHSAEMDRGLDTVKKVLKVGKTVEDVRKFMNTPTGKAVKTGLTGAFAAAAAYATGGTSAAATAGASVVIRRAANHYTNGPR